MPRPPRTFWAVWLFLLAGCSLVTDFDHDKLGASPDQRDEAGVTIPNPHMDAHVGPAPTADTGVAIIDDDAGTGMACQTHANCGPNQLCCGGSCIATTDGHCSDCEQGCPLATTNVCNQRTCGCGTGSACSGDKPFCRASGAAATCVACRDTSDCERTGGTGTQCIDGTCAACNPADNSGCGGDKPICNKTTFTCEACKSSPDNCPGNPVCTPSGACGGCTANDMADCTNPTAPICNLGANPSVCRGCMSDAECMSEWNRAFCVNNQRCSTCRPSDDMGCVASSATPDCRPNAQGVYTCQGCQADSCGTGLRCNAQTGKCVACRNDDDCDTNSATPFCDTATGTCKGCNTAGGQNASNLWCTANTLLQLVSRPICHSTSGRCVRCDGANNNGCVANSNAPRCYAPDATMPQSNVCVGCRPGVAADCTGATPICDANTRRCRGCAGAADCSASAPVCNTTSGTCVRCTVGGSGAAAGCTNANAPLCITGNSGPECVQCTGHAQCPAATPLCATSTHTCVPCNSASVPAGDRDAACDARTKGDICTAGGTCADCEMAGNHGCPGGLCCPGTGGALGCVPHDPRNCASCGNMCSGATPICLPTTNICGCVNNGDCPGNQMCAAGICVPMTGSTGVPSATGAAP